MSLKQQKTTTNIDKFDKIVSKLEDGYELSNGDIHSLLKESQINNNALIFEFLLDSKTKEDNAEDFYKSILDDYEKEISKLDHGELKSANNIIFQSMLKRGNRSFIAILNYELLKVNNNGN